MPRHLKILIISHNSFSKVFNNGKTLESIFRAFDKHNLAQIFFSKNEEPDLDYCNRYFKITDTAVLKSILKGFSDCGEAISADQSNKRINETEIKKAKPSLFEFAKSKANYLTLVRDLLWSFNSWKSKSLINWIQEFKPDVVFYVGGNFGFSHKIARFVSKKYNLSLVSYFTDDYLIYPISKNLLEYFQHQRIKMFYPKTINQSSICYSIGELMANEYSSYFNKDFFPLINAVEKQDYLQYEPNSNAVMSYFGGLHLNRWQMIIKLAKLSSNVTINVYSVTKPRDEILYLFQESKINFKGAVEGENLQTAIKNSDILLHVESNDLYNKSLTKLSISTKIPEYLMSGRFILGFGPDDVASMRILSDNKIGKVISSSLSDRQIQIELKNIIADFLLRDQIGKKGYDYAVEHFDNNKNAKEFKKQLENLNS